MAPRLGVDGERALPGSPHFSEGSTWQLGAFHRAPLNPFPALVPLSPILPFVCCSPCIPGR